MSETNKETPDSKWVCLPAVAYALRTNLSHVHGLIGNTQTMRTRIREDGETLYHIDDIIERVKPQWPTPFQLQAPDQRDDFTARCQELPHISPPSDLPPATKLPQEAT